MTSLPPAEKPPHGETPAPAAPDFAIQMHEFWAKNHTQIYFLIAAILLAIVAKEGWGYFSAMHERGIAEDYAKVANTPEALARFADEHSGHALAGVALLRVADDKYSAGDFKAAQAAYSKAAPALKQADLQSRAKLGAAMSQLAAGDAAGGSTALQALMNDTAAAKPTRAEAAYQLASLASSAGRADDVRKFANEITKIEPAGVWAQRSLTLLAQLPVDPKAATPSSGISFQPGKE